MSSLSSTLTWLSLLFLSPLCLPRTPTQTTPVLKSFSPITLLFNFLISTPLPSETLLLTLAPGPSILTSFLTPLTLLSLETSMLTTQHGTDSFPLTRSEMTCFAESLPPVRKFRTTPPLPRSFTIPLGVVLPLISRYLLRLSLPTVSGALSLALARTISPLKLSSPSLQFVTQTLVPSNSITKRPVGMFTNLILLSTFPLLILMHLTSTRLPTPFPSSLSKLPRPLSPLVALVVPPKPGGPRKRNLQCGNDGGPAPWHTDLSRTASDTWMLLVRRPQSFLEPNLQPGKPPVLTCLPVLILVLFSGFSMPSRAKRTPPKTLLFPIALALLTLPTTMPLTFAHIYLKQHPVPRAELKDSS